MTEEAPELQATQQDKLGLMEEILQRLRLLNYEREFVRGKGLKQINTAYFAIQTNPMQQFNYFKHLAKWLLQLNDVQGSDFSKYDDPMTVSSNIQTECKKLGIPCEYPPMKLKSGSGEEVLNILSQLTAKAMKKQNFVFKKPKLEAVASQPQKQEEENTQVDMQQQVENVEVEEDEFEDREPASKQQITQDKQVINSNISQKDWQIECERVANKLKIAAKPDNKDWRAHVESTRTCGDTIKKTIPQSRGKLQKLGDELGKTLERIYKSQKIINSNMSEVGSEYRNKSEQMKKLSTLYNNLSSSLKEMNENYRVISEKFESVSLKTQQHSGTMTDSSPVVKIKAAIQKIVAEVKSIDVRIGVMNHTVMQYRTKQKNIQENGLGMHLIEQFDDQ